MSTKAFLTILVFFGLHLTGSPLFAQVKEQALAQEYYKLGEFEKASVIFKKLYEEQPNSPNYYKSYYNCLLNLGEYADLEKFVKKHIRQNKGQLHLFVDLGYVYDRQGNRKEAEQQYERAISELGSSRTQSVQLANAFSGVNEYAYAIRTYERAKTMVAGYKFNNELANLYYRQGDIPSMISAYLDYLSENVRYMQNVKNSLQRNLDDDADFMELQTQLYQRIQRNSNDKRYPELLIWNFIQLKDFESAFIQTKALDKRFKENGRRVFELAEIARQQKDWDAAISAFEYLVDQGQRNPYYFNARNAIVNCRKEKVLSSDFSPQDIMDLKSDYELFLSEYNRPDLRAANTERDLAKLEAFYLHDINSAVERLKTVLTWPSLQIRDKAAIKLDLGDYYLMQGEVWESTLLYSQVDKTMKDGPLGEEARFKNAQFSYFRGDFDWAQAQLDVLKASTTELVANDALNLSVFISENLGMDTTAEHLKKYGRAELLAYQNRDAEALLVLDSLVNNTASALLQDDVLMLQARIALKNRDYDTASVLLNRIATDYSYDMLVDDALYMLGQLYETHLDQPQKAMEYYERIMLDHKDSIYVIEARERYRALRGDDLN